MESALQPLLNGSVSNANMTVNLADGAADIDFSAAAVPRNYQGALLRVTDSAGRSIFGYVYTNGAGTVQNIVSVKGGSTRNWTVQETGFDDNDAGGYTYQLSRTPPVVVASGSVTADNFKLDLTDTNAFVELVGVDLSPYQDGRHLIGICCHAADLMLLGHISDVAPAGLTLDPELITVAADRDFSADTGFWTLGTGWSIGGGVANAVAASGNMSRAGLLVNGACYQITGTYNIASNNLYAKAGFWTKRVFTGVGAVTYHFCLGGTEAGYVSLICTCTVDDVGWQRVTDIAATGALIVSTQRGATRKWYYKSPQFQVDSTGYDYKIYYIGD